MLAETARNLRGFRKIIDKVSETGMLLDARRIPHARPKSKAEAMAVAAESMCFNPTTLIRRRIQQVGVTRTTLRRIIYKDLGMFAYKVQLVQEF